MKLRLCEWTCRITMLGSGCDHSNKCWRPRSSDSKRQSQRFERFYANRLDRS